MASTTGKELVIKKNLGIYFELSAILLAKPKKLTNFVVYYDFKQIP